MSRHLKRNLCFVKLVSSTTYLQRKALLKSATPDQIKTLCEIIHNVVYNDDLAPSKKYISNLKSHKYSLRRLAESKCTERRKRELLLRVIRIIPKLLKPIIEKLEYSVLTQDGH